jgi:hypothetical protein
VKNKGETKEFRGSLVLFRDGMEESKKIKECTVNWIKDKVKKKSIIKSINIWSNMKVEMKK